MTTSKDKEAQRLRLKHFFTRTQTALSPYLQLSETSSYKNVEKMQLMAKRALVYHISTEPNRLFLTGQRIELRRDGHDSTAYRVGKK